MFEGVIPNDTGCSLQRRAAASPPALRHPGACPRPNQACFACRPAVPWHLVEAPPALHVLRDDTQAPSHTLRPAVARAELCRQKGRHARLVHRKWAGIWQFPVFHACIPAVRRVPFMLSLKGGSRSGGAPVEARDSSKSGRMGGSDGGEGTRSCLASWVGPPHSPTLCACSIIAANQSGWPDRERIEAGAPSCRATVFKSHSYQQSCYRKGERFLPVRETTWPRAAVCAGP